MFRNLIPRLAGEDRVGTPDYPGYGHSSMSAGVALLGHIDRLGQAGVSDHVVLDHYATHETAAVKRWFLRHPEYHLHVTPTSASWLNQVERLPAAITEDRIRRGVF